MSRFTLMRCNITTGAYEEILPDFVKLSPSFEMSDVGALTIEYPRSGIGFASLSADARVEVAVLFDGVEMDDGRFRIQSLSGDEVKTDENQTFQAVSLANRFKKAIVYSGTGSTTVASDQTFLNSTPGGILKALFDQNAARGTGRVCDEITYASFSPTQDSAGNAWTLSYGNITYQVGVNYLDIMRNMFDNGMIEFKMVGRDLRVYNAGGLGVDRTIVAEPVILRRGVDYSEAPQTRTNEQIAGVALIQGDNEVLRQETDASVVAAWGADETFISQGGISDSTTLGVVAQSELERRSQVRAQRTRRIELGAGPNLPYTHYRCSDYIFDETASGRERLRIRQMVLESDESGLVYASVVLNDKFLEQEIAVARKVNGILGGATAGGSSAIPTPSPTEDNTTPSAPATVTATSSVYVDTLNDRTASQGHLAWPAVTTNTDTSTLADLDHYETQFRWDENFPATPANALAPGRDFDAYTRRFDRRGKGYGWLGGDGGASARATSGKDFWAFADTNLGVADQEGRILSNWSFIHNSWVLTDPNDSSVFDAKWGYANRFSDDDAFFKTTVGLWQADANCSVARSTSTFYYGTASLQVTATAGGDATARIAAGAFAYPVTGSTQYSVMCRARSVGTARQVALGIRWYDASNALISTSTSSNFTGSNSAWTRYVHTATAPANAVRAAMIVIFRSAGAAQVFNVDVCQLSQGNATYYGWNDPGRALAGGPCAVLHPEELGGAELTDLDDIFWVDAVHTVGTKILVAYTRYSAVGTFKNAVYVAQYDGTTHAFESITTWSTSDTFNWWTATAADGTYLYVYGYESLAAGNRAMHVMRVPIGNVLAGTKEWYTGTGTTWTTTRASSGAIYTGYSAQFHGVTQIGSTWYAVITEYGGGTMKYLTAPNPWGAWTMQGAFYTQPEMGSGLVAYFPRIHRQLESNAGIPMSYSVNGSVNGVNSTGNIRYYAPKFLIGPAASVNPTTPGSDWSESRIIESGTLVDHISGIPPGANFQGRVRAVDYNGNASTWTNSNVIRTSLDTVAPNKPSIPIVSSAFQGIRIEWDGLDFQGGPPPADWAYLEIHASEVAAFQPGPLTKIDTIRTRSGGVFPWQGLVYGRVYYVRFVSVDSRGNRSDPSDVASTQPEQLVDVNEIANKLITGAKVADATLAVRSLTVAALEPSITPNGNMEEEETNGSGVGQGRPYGWTSSGWTWGVGATIGQETTSPIGGARSLKVTMAGPSDGLIVRSIKFPVAPGKLLAVQARLKGSRSVATGNVVHIQIATGVTESDAGAFPGASSTWHTATTSSLSGSIQSLEASAVVPANHKWATVFLANAQASDGSGYEVLWDDVFVNPIGGSAFIADLSVLNGKIANLAVDNAKIANVSVGKLTAGILSADMTVSARIKTADTGARVELNSAGLQAYNSAGTQTVSIASASGDATFTGTFRTDFDNSTTPHLKVADDGDRTTIYFFGTDALAESGNYAFINSPLDANNDPTLGLNSSEFEYFTGVDGRHRLYMANDTGIFLETVMNDEVTNLGGRLALRANNSVFENFISNGAQTGGRLTINSTGFVLQRNSPTVNGAQITGDISAVWLDAVSAGDRNARVKIAANGEISFEQGYFPNFADLGAEQAVFSGAVGAASGTSWAVGYGTTRASGNFPIVTPQFNAAVGWAVTAASNTGFTVSSTNTVAGAIRFWCYRVA